MGTSIDTARECVDSHFWMEIWPFSYSPRLVGPWPSLHQNDSPSSSRKTFLCKLIGLRYSQYLLKFVDITLIIAALFLDMIMVIYVLKLQPGFPFLHRNLQQGTK